MWGSRVSKKKKKKKHTPPYDVLVFTLIAGIRRHKHIKCHWEC